MKDFYPPSTECSSLYFISHMVQMKVIWDMNNIIISFLYIPHGSDESKGSYCFKSHFSDFISHMVQMKAFNDTISFSVSPFFISHMVQMKAWVVRAALQDLKAFISHMVQMKVTGLWFSHIFLYALYIPHGSDERIRYLWVLEFQERFISHMVQMKVLLLLILVISFLTLYPTWFRWKRGLLFRLTTVYLSLYPTWFRWKQ